MDGLHHSLVSMVIFRLVRREFFWFEMVLRVCIDAILVLDHCVRVVVFGYLLKCFLTAVLNLNVLVVHPVECQCSPSINNA